MLSLHQDSAFRAGQAAAVRREVERAERERDRVLAHLATRVS